MKDEAAEQARLGMSTLRAREDSLTRLARRSKDSERKRVKRSDPEQILKEAGTRREAREEYRVLVPW